MKKSILLLYFTFFLLTAQSQDIIFKKDGTEIQAKVLEVMPDLVKYKIYSSVEGPIYSEYKSEILLIKYEDGRKDIFIEDTKSDVVEKAEISNTFIDERDNQRYKFVVIGEQTWMAENLNYSMEMSRCYKDNPDYCKKYGKLYLWEEAIEACPSGWHLPDDDEWKTLEIELGMQNDVDKVGWRGHRPGQGYLLKIGGGSGFNVVFAGYGYVDSWTLKDGKEAFFWTASEMIKNKREAWYRRFTDRASVDRGFKDKRFMLSVRCVKD